MKEDATPPQIMPDQPLPTLDLSLPTSDLSLPTSDLSQIRADLSQVRPDLRQVRPDLRQIQADLSQVQADLRQVRPDLRQVRPGLALFWGAALCVVALDQASKAWVRGAIPLDGARALLPGWVHLSHVHNKGAAWGAFSGQRWLLVAVALGVIALVTSVARDVARRGRLAACGLGLILGGAVGNLVDRIAQGHVTDFVDLDTPLAFLRTFPVWNIADGALSVGAILMLLSGLEWRMKKRE